MTEPHLNCTSPSPTSPVATTGHDEDDSNTTNNMINSNSTDEIKTVATVRQEKDEKPATTKAPLPLVSTPARDPASLVTKRMQNLRLHGNTTLSPAPFAACSPLRTFHNNSNNLVITPNKQYDLTPVIRNTSTTACPIGSTSVDLDLDLDLELDFDLDMLDARGGSNTNDSMAAFSGGSNVFAARRLKPGYSSNLPPLSNRGLLPGPRPPAMPSSNERQPSSSLSSSPAPPPVAIDVPIDPNPPLRAPELAFLPPNVQEVVPFPPSGGKGYSFTSRKQYEQEQRRRQQQQHDEADPLRFPIAANNINDLAPYQPSRQDPGLEQPQELGSIFITKRCFTNGDAHDDDLTPRPPSLLSHHDMTSNMNTPDGNVSSWSADDICCDDDDDGDEEVSLEDNLLLQQAIPLGDRQWSIPSIRLANHLNGSVNSCTTYHTDEEEEDDESSIRLEAYYRDDASLSSYGSYSHLSGTVFVMAADRPPQQEGEAAMEDTLERMDSGSNAMDTQHAPSPTLQQQQPTNNDFFNNNNNNNNNTNDYHVRRRRQKRKQQRDRKALEWLQAVKATTSENEVAEAASSKFLRMPNSSNSSAMMTTMIRRNINNNAQITLYDKPQQKRLSSAAVESSTFGLTFAGAAAAIADEQDEASQLQHLINSNTLPRLHDINSNKGAVFNRSKGHQGHSVKKLDHD